MSVTGNVLSCIGNTPMIEISQIDTGCCRLFLKLENQNPTGSIKDRIGLSMIEAAEREGLIKPGGTLIEASAGNTGLGLALVAAQKGYRLLIVLPDKMAYEKVLHLKALGAETRLTRSDVEKGHPEYYQDLAQRLAAETPGSFYVNQFSNPANPLAHETTTGPEIWSQMAHDLDAIICGVGSGGTMTGLSRFFARVAPEVEMVLADPQGSVLADVVAGRAPGEVGSWLVEGIGEDFVPPNCDLSRVRQAYSIGDREAMLTARELLAKEGILAGSSTGTLLAAALRYCRAQSEPRRVVSFVCDSGNKYLSKMFNDFWMLDQGLIQREQHHNLCDLISRRYADGSIVTVRPDDSLMQAYRNMRLFEVSQLPVIDDGELVGVIDESDLLIAVHGHAGAFDAPVADAMVTRLETVSPDAAIEDLLPIFARDHVAIVKDGEEFIGLITRIDVLAHLRRSLKA